MNELANKIQVVITTLEDLDIKATYDNMNHMMGIYHTLADVRDKLNSMKQEEQEHGNADAE